MLKWGMIELILAVAAAASPQWSMEQSADPISDARSVRLLLQNKPTVLQIQCKVGGKRSFDVVIGTTSYLGGRLLARKTIVRFDALTPTESIWGYNDHFAAMLSGEREFISGLQRSTKLAIRARDGDDAPMDFVFDTRGADVQVGKFLAECRKLGIN